MLAQTQLPLPRPAMRPIRAVRRPFHPSQPAGPYKLPREVVDRLAAALQGFRNREQAFRLATFIGRFWSAPGQLLRAAKDGFHLDRRELADRPDLGLTEGEVRGAIGALERVGFLDRVIVKGSAYQPTEEGLRRKPIRFLFGPEYRDAFQAANKRARATQERRSGSARPPAPEQVRRPLTPLPEAAPLSLPKKTALADRALYLGELISDRPPLRGELSRRKPATPARAAGNGSASSVPKAEAGAAALEDLLANLKAAPIPRLSPAARALIARQGRL